MTNDATNETILIDAGHGNDFSGPEIDALVSTLVRNGHTVRFYDERSRDLNASLRRADAFVVINPNQRYTRAEIEGVRAFADAGGRLLLVGDPPTTQIEGSFFSPQIRTVGNTHTTLASTFGVAYEAGTVYNMRENANNFESVYASTESTGGLAAGVDRVVMHGAAPVTVADGTRVLTGVDGTQLSSTRRSGTFALLVRSGNVAALGDSEILAPENAYEADNEVLVGNLADFLVGGEKTPGAPEEPEPESGPGPERPMPRPGPSPPPESGDGGSTPAGTTAARG
jgi:hypothetical protein